MRSSPGRRLPRRELYTHSITDAGGPAPTDIAMMKYNDVKAIVDGLK